MRISDWSSDVCSSDLAHLASSHRVIDGLSTATNERGQIVIAFDLCARHQLVATIGVKGWLGKNLTADFHRFHQYRQIACIAQIIGFDTWCCLRVGRPETNAATAVWTQLASVHHEAMSRSRLAHVI